MAGARINKILQNWNKQKKENETQPRWRGKMFCFLYFGNNPILTIGPDFKFTVLELVFFNLLCLLPIRSYPFSSAWFKITLGITAL